MRLESVYRCGVWFREPTDALVQQAFLDARCIQYRDNKVVMPILELANHGVGPTYFTQSGVSVRWAFQDEVLLSYATLDPLGMFIVWGFAAEQPQAFSIALGGKVGRNPVQIGRDLGTLSPIAQYWIPRSTVAGDTAKLEFLMIGNRQFPRVCKPIFYKIMQDAGFTEFEEGFETVCHANRRHFLNLLAEVEAVEGPMALTLRRMARYQLDALSYCYGNRAIQSV
jgi:hypothetical protein